MRRDSHELDLRITWPGFDRIAEMAASPTSTLYAAEPDVVFLNYNQEAKLADIYHRTLARDGRLQMAIDFLHEIEFVVGQIATIRPSTKIVIHSLYWVPFFRVSVTSTLLNPGAQVTSVSA